MLPWQYSVRNIRFLNMKAVVLAAGKGERLGNLTKHSPKPMLMLGGKPIIQYCVEGLADAGIRDIFINLYYLPKVITSFLGDGSKFGVNIAYSYEDKLLGTAGAVKKIGRSLTETFLVVYSDTLRKIDYKELINLHLNKGSLATVALYRTPSQKGCGIVELGNDFKITSFLEKPKNYSGMSNFANAGVYCLEPEVMDFIPEDAEYDFASELFPKLLNRGEKLSAFLLDEPVLDIGTVRAYKRAQEMLG